MWRCFIDNWGPVFFGLIFCCSQSGDDPEKDLAKFGYKLTMKENIFKRLSVF
jgi:hypothetical protein